MSSPMVRRTLKRRSDGRWIAWTWTYGRCGWAPARGFDSLDLNEAIDWLVSTGLARGWVLGMVPVEEYHLVRP